MKTREQLYSQEAASLLRDVTMYRVLREEQVLALYPEKQKVIENLLSYLVKQRRIYYSDGYYLAQPDDEQNIDHGLLAALWVLIDFIDRVEYHSIGDYPAKSFSLPMVKCTRSFMSPQAKRLLSTTSCPTLERSLLST